MSFDWGKFIGLAEDLFNRAGDFSDREACLRTAISRAYYGAFGLARRVAESEGLDLTGGPEDHEKVRAFFLQSGDQRRRGIGAHLDRLRRKRNRADYDLTYSVTRRECMLSLEQARRLEQTLPEIQLRGDAD